MTSATAAPAARMPAAFLGHGTPMNAIDRNRYTEAWRAFGARVPRPRAILMISAHWYINASAVTAMEQPRTIHDFYGFPEELFAVEYPARGDPALAGEITELVKPTWVGQDRDSWGIDHGAWSVLVHAFPSADIPVVQLSANALKPFDISPRARRQASSAPRARSAGARQRQHRAQPGPNGLGATRTGYPWARSFDDSAREVMTADPAGVPELQAHQYFSAAVPTPDHFIPLLYLAGLAASDGNATEVLVDGYAMGSLSMTAYTLGCERIVYDGVGGAPVLPKIPPDESNI